MLASDQSSPRRLRRLAERALGVAGWFVTRVIRSIWRVLGPPLTPLFRLLGRGFEPTWGFVAQPVQAGALCCFLMAARLGGVWYWLKLALEGQTRPSPIELAQRAATRSNEFLWIGVLWRSEERRVGKECRL